MCSCCLFSLHSIKRKGLKSVETIDDTVKFVYGYMQWAPDTRKRLWKSAVEI